MPWDKPYIPPKNQRLDPDLYRQAGQITFITIRAYRSACPFVTAEFNQMIIDTLIEEQERSGFSIYTYCLMPDHLHYLISPGVEGASVLVFTNQFKGKTTNRSWKLGRSGKLWQPRSYDHIVRSEKALRNIARYIIENPVRKGLVESPEDWLWSGYLNEL